jgi:hypothetical protein
MYRLSSAYFSVIFEPEPYAASFIMGILLKMKCKQKLMKRNEISAEKKCKMQK